MTLWHKMSGILMILSTFVIDVCSQKVLTSSLRSLIIWNWVSADVKRELTAGWYSDTFSIPAEGVFHFTFMINLYFYCHLYSYWYWYRSSSRSATHCQFRPEALFTLCFCCHYLGYSQILRQIQILKQIQNILKQILSQIKYKRILYNNLDTDGCKDPRSSKIATAQTTQKNIFVGGVERGFWSHPVAEPTKTKIRLSNLAKLKMYAGGGGSQTTWQRMRK